MGFGAVGCGGGMGWILLLLRSGGGLGTFEGNACLRRLRMGGVGGVVGIVC